MPTNATNPRDVHRERLFSGVDATTGEVVEFRGGKLALPGHASAVGLELPEDLTEAEWRQVGDVLKSAERSLMWWIGDWLRFGEKRWGEKYAEAQERTGRAYQTLANAKSVAEAFPDFSRRRENLSWGHHAEVAGRDDADELLDRAEREDISVRELRAEVSRRRVAAELNVPGSTCTVADLQALADRGERFGTIYADPPWLYDNQGTRAATGNHYGGLTIDELCALPVKALAADDAHLHLWTTNGFLFDCPRLFDAWGFEFRSSLVWVKPQMGIGNYWRNSHEILLTAIRGDAKRFNDHSLKSWLSCDRGRHSGKPEQVRAMIEKASPGPFLELFGRSPATGWTVWGNQIAASLLHPDVREVA
jgi:N6-adenosine-specific RNA methylase IME4